MDEAVRLYHRTRAENPVAFDENTMNNLGYTFLGRDQTEEAIEVFKLNTEAYPESWNVWDSLGEAYMKHGDKERAIRYYEKSLELNPGNDNGRDALKRLRSE